MSCLFGIIGDDNDLEFAYVEMRKTFTVKEMSYESDQGNNFRIGGFSVYNDQHTIINLPNENLRIWVDAKIYNRKRLCQKLDLSPKEESLSDLDLISYAYLEWRQDFVYHLNGDYVIIVFEIGRKDFTIYTDPLGIRPFHYTFQNGNFYFASFLHGLKAISKLNFTVNMDFTYQMLCSMGTMHKSQTPFIEIKKLSGSCILRFTNNKIRISSYQYFNLNPKLLQLPSYQDYVEAFQEQLERAVINRIPNEVKDIGTEFSGGLDSTGIAAIAQSYCQKHRITLHAFPYALPSANKSDFIGFLDNRTIIDESATFLKIQKLHYIGREEVIIDKLIKEFTEKFCQPAFHYSFYALRQISKIQEAQNVKLIFSGLGGDECVTFMYLYLLINLAKKEKIFKLLAQSNITSIRSIIRALIDYHPLLKNKKIPASGLFQQALLLGHPDIKKFTSTTVKHHYWSAESLNEEIYRKLTFPVTAERRLHESISAYHVGKEISYPFYDIELIQFLLSVPNKIKVKDKEFRRFYKDAISKWVNLPNFINQKKNGNQGGTMPALGYFASKQFNHLIDSISKFDKTKYKFINFEKFEEYQKEGASGSTLLNFKILGVLNFLEKYN